MDVKKSKKADLEHKRGNMLQLALIVTLSMTLFAFEWGTEKVELKKTVAIVDNTVPLELPPISITKVKPKPQPKKYDWTKPPVIDPNPTPEPNPLPEPDPDPIPDPVIDPDLLGGDEPGTGGEPIEIIDFMIVENMPHYEDCEDATNRDAQDECTQARFIKTIGKKIRMPQIWKDSGEREATAHVSFRVNTKGKVEDVKVLNENRIHPSLVKESIKVVKAIPPMVPGKQRGKAVNVRYVIPIKYRVR